MRSLSLADRTVVCTVILACCAAASVAMGWRQEAYIAVCAALAFVVLALGIAMGRLRKNRQRRPF